MSLVDKRSPKPEELVENVRSSAASEALSGARKTPQRISLLCPTFTIENPRMGENSELLVCLERGAKVPVAMGQNTFPFSFSSQLVALSSNLKTHMTHPCNINALPFLCKKGSSDRATLGRLGDILK